MNTPSPLPAAPRSGRSRATLYAILMRVLLLGIGLGSVALVWWSINRLPPVARQLREKDLARATLANEVQQLELNWNDEAAKKLETQYQAARARLFQGPEESTTWRAAFLDRGQELAFDTDLVLGQPQPYPKHEQNLTVLPATLRLQPSPQGRGLTNSPYERLLELASALTRQERRVDLMELSVASNSNSVAQTRAELRLWARTPTTPTTP